MSTDYAALEPTRSEKFRQRILPLILFGLLLIVIPFFGPSRTTLTLLNHMGINIVFALAFNMLLGRAGLLTFGHAVYVGLGGYFCVHILNWIDASEGGFWSSVPVFSMPIWGFAMGALAGAVIGDAGLVENRLVRPVRERDLDRVHGAARRDQGGRLHPQAHEVAVQVAAAARRRAQRRGGGGGRGGGAPAAAGRHHG